MDRAPLAVFSGVLTTMATYTSTAPDPAHALTPSGNLRRRMLTNLLFEGGAGLAAVIAVGVLILMILLIAINGIGSVSFGFLTKALPPPTGGVGGIGPAIIGSAEIVAISVAIALPLSVLIALAVTQFTPPRIAGVIKTIIDVMNGLPTIVVGVFIFSTLVTSHGMAGWKGAVALTIVVLPLITRATIEALNRVPATLTEAANALGVARWRAVIGVILPTAAPSILTATILAAARAAGETAPVLFTTNLFLSNVELNPLKPVPNIPLEIYALMSTGNPVGLKMAWGAAFVLLVLILAANVGARALLRRAQRKRGL